MPKDFRDGCMLQAIHMQFLCARATWNKSLLEYRDPVALGCEPDRRTQTVQYGLNHSLDIQAHCRKEHINTLHLLLDC